MDKICSMAGCNNTSDNFPTGHFFQFPRDFDLCFSWVENCKNPKIVEDFAYGGALPCLKRYVCSHHFSSSDFINSEHLHLGVKPDAVPHYCPLKTEDAISSQVYVKEEFYYSDNEGSADTIKDEISCTNRNTWENTTQSTAHLDITVLHFRKSCESDQCIFRNCDNSCNIVHQRRNKKQQYKDRSWKSAARAALRRSKESEEGKKIRKHKNAIRAANRRRQETDEQRLLRRLKDKIRSAQRRKRETEMQSKIRKYNDAVRAAFRRSQESSEQKTKRRLYDMIRAAKRRSNETAEQRQKRLTADRERAAKRRAAIKVNSSTSKEAQSDLEECNTSSISDNGDPIVVNDILSKTYCKSVTNDDW